MRVSRYILLVLLAFCLIGLAPVYAAAEPIGMVLAMEGNVTAQRDGTDVPLAVKDAVHASDVVRTGTGSKVQILLNDDSSITLGPDTNLELQEFADSGKDSAFAAHIGQGSVRLITGRITEANPDGFKVTTPMATVGIRGTLLVFDVTKDRTMVDFHNSNKTLMVNGTSILENNRIIITADDIQVNNLMLQDKAIGESFAVTAGGSSVVEDDESVTALDTDNKIENMNNLEINTFEDIMKESSGIGLISGSTAVGQFTDGVFSFNVDLQSGAISNAASTGATGINASNTWDIYSGTGQFSNGAFRIEGFSGIYTVAGTVHSIESGTFMDGGGSYTNIGDIVTGGCTIFYNNGAFDTFPMNGSRVQ